jgi:site-specific recombinase XerD
MGKEKVEVVLPESAINFLNYCKINKGLSEDSVQGYERDLRIFVNYVKIHKKQKNRNVKDIDIKKIESTDMAKYVVYLVNELKNTERTIKRKTATLKSYFEYLQNVIRLITANPMYGLATPKIPKKNPIYLTLEESLKLVQSIKENSLSNYERDYCIIVLLLNTAMRISELESMKVNSLKGDILTIVGKGNKERTIYLNELSIEAINQYLKVRHVYNIEDNSLFNIGEAEIRVVVKKYIKRADIDDFKKYTPHKLRHTSATLMYKYGHTDIRKLQGILGHSNINNTTIYTHVDDEQLREAVNSNPLNDLLTKK